ncbi:MAG: DNA polymerase II small subunit [Nanoarchaeota archaeon]|nr:DNA polymerase II small subunit [Nanoarchaeota archaeon]
MEKTILKICMEKGFLLDKEMLNLLSGLDEESAKKLIESIVSLKFEEKVITKTFFSKNLQKIQEVLIDGKNKTVIENLFFNLGYSRTEIEQKEVRKEEKVELIEEKQGKVKLLSVSFVPPKKVCVADFVKHYRTRYEQIKKILLERNLDNLTSLRKIGDKKENYTIIASVFDKRITKNKNLLLNVEDSSGRARILINANKKEVFDKAKDLLLDDIVAFQVSGNKEWLYANDVIFPDCVLHEKKKYEKDEWVAFSSDAHIGSTMFLEENFKKFLEWLNGERGDEKQKEIAKKVKYLFLVGDCIDGVGVYPDQERFLNIKNIKDQYNKLSEFLRYLRKDIKIILSPGQHDGVRVAEPQPIVEESWAPELHKIENLTLVPNPALVEIDGGFKILMYHGASMHSIIDEIEDIRLNYKSNSPTRVVKEMLKRRHLAPTHSSVTYIPNEKEDPLLITQIPDIVATGDLHRPEISIYNNILLIASSCWQSITPFEEKVGNHPDPCKVPLFNLKTREIKIIDFGDTKEDKGEEK